MTAQKASGQNSKDDIIQKRKDIYDYNQIPATVLGPKDLDKPNFRNDLYQKLKEEFCRVRISALSGELPAELPFENVIQRQQSNDQAVITVRNTSPEQIEQTAESLDCQVEIQTLPLEEIYKLVVR